MPSFLTCATRSGIRLAPSSNEYSLWVWRWTKAMTANSISAVAPSSSFQHGVQRDTASLQQHQKMIEEIGRLGRETLGLLRIRRHDDLDRLLAHLLRDLGHARARAAAPCTSLRAARPPAVRSWSPAGSAGVPPGSSPDVVCAVLRHGRREAGARARVAGRAGLLDPVQDGVAVAIDPDFPDAPGRGRTSRPCATARRGICCSSAPGRSRRSARAPPGSRTPPSGRRRNGFPGPLRAPARRPRTGPPPASWSRTPGTTYRRPRRLSKAVVVPYLAEDFALRPPLRSFPT